MWLFIILHGVAFIFNDAACLKTFFNKLALDVIGKRTFL